MKSFGLNKKKYIIFYVNNIYQTDFILYSFVQAWYQLLKTTSIYMSLLPFHDSISRKNIKSKHDRSNNFAVYVFDIEQIKSVMWYWLSNDEMMHASTLIYASIILLMTASADFSTFCHWSRDFKVKKKVKRFKSQQLFENRYFCR